MKKIFSIILVILLFSTIISSAREDVVSRQLLTEKETTPKSRNVSGFNPKTNQTISWCGVDFSFPAYFNMFEEIEDLRVERWIHYYPKEESYYCSLMFQEISEIKSQEQFDQSLKDIIDVTFFSGEIFTNIEVIKSNKAEVAGLSSWFVQYISKDDEDREESQTTYIISFNPLINRTFIITCAYDKNDQSYYDYLGDFGKMIKTAKISDDSFNNIKDIAKTESSYDFAFARHLGEYSKYLLFDIDDKIVRVFTSNDKGVLVGKIKGDLSTQITISYNCWDSVWKETFKRKKGSQTEAILIDDDGFDWLFEQIPVSEAEAILNQDGYYDMNP